MSSRAPAVNLSSAFGRAYPSLAAKVRHAANSTLLVTSALVFSVFLGVLVAHGRSSVAAAAPLLLVTALFVLRRPENGLLAGTVLILLVPSWYAIGPAQAGVVRIAVLLALSGIVVTAVRGEHFHVNVTYVDIFIGGVGAVALISWIVSPPVPRGGQLAFATVLPAGFYVAGRLFSATARTKILWVLMVAGGLSALEILYEFIFVQHSIFIPQDQYIWNGGGGDLFRPGGVFGSPPGAVAVLSMTSLAGASLLSNTAGIRRFVLWACLALSVAAIIITFTRAGMLAIVAGGIVYLALLRPPSLSRLIYVVTIVVVVASIFLLPRVTGRSWYQEGVERRQVNTLAIRQSYWAGAWPVILNSPAHIFVGHGVNSLNTLPNSRLVQSPQPDIADTPLASNSPHSQYVRTLVEEGFIGLIVMLGWTVGAAAWAAFMALRLPFEQRGFYAAGAAGLISLLSVSFVDDTLRHDPTFAIGALLAGLMMSAAARRGETR
jgi:O-antigen ligase